MNYIVKIKELDRRIRRRATGSPKELAGKMNISRATLFRLITFYKKEMKAPVYFDKGINSYCYEYPGTLTIKFVETKSEDIK